MNWFDRWRGAPRPEPLDDEAASASDVVEGERTIPSVNRERSVRSRVSAALALGAVALLGGGFLIWYYSTSFQKVREQEEAQKRSTEARAAGELKLPPLGRVDPPLREAKADGPLGGAPPAPNTMRTGGVSSAAASGPAQKTPEQLALERQLEAPVLVKGSNRIAAAANPVAVPGAAPATIPGFDALLGSLGGRAGQSGREDVDTLGRRLVPTATPAVSAEVVPTRRFLLPKGAFVDCTLETAIDSTFDGMVTCIGASDVYSADGKVVLIERGTKYIGEKRGDVRQGQGRVFVLWSEARTPTGVVVRLDSPGTDELGRTGLPGEVDTHFWDRFGAAILVSVIDGGLQALASDRQRDGGTTIQLNPGGTRDVMTEVLRSTIGIPPTVVKHQGDRIQVLVARDVDFRTVYALRSAADD